MPKEWTPDLLDKYKLGSQYKAIDQKLFDVASYYTEKRFQEGLDVPQYAVAELGDTYETLGAQYGLDPTTLAQMNQDISAPSAGGAVNLPLQPPTPTPDPKVHLTTAETTPETD